MILFIFFIVAIVGLAYALRHIIQFALLMVLIIFLATQMPKIPPSTALDVPQKVPGTECPAGVWPPC